MSRIGKLTIEILDGVEAKMNQRVLFVKGKKGELSQEIPPMVNVSIDTEGKEIKISVNKPADHNQNALWGLFRSLVNNMVVGVTHGFEKKLEINGIGYKAAANGRKVILNVGYSHPIEFNLPEGIDCRVEGPVITVSGCNKQLVGEVAANIRKVRKPEPYKGKGIRYENEVVRRKAGKTVVGAGA